MLVGTFEKEPFDEFEVALSYDDVIQDSETISACTVQAFGPIDTAPTTDVSSTLLANTGGPPPNANLISGTATGGSTTTMIDTSKNFSALGVRSGDKVYNSTSGKRWVARVKSITSTTNPFDTLNFDAQASTAASGDLYSFFLAKASVKAGTDAKDYEIKWKMTTSTSRKFEDSAVMRVCDQ